MNSNGKSQYRDDELLKLIGRKIREVRLSRKITTEEFALEYGIDYSQINRMELGKVNFSICYLYRIPELLGIDPRELLVKP